MSAADEWAKAAEELQKAQLAYEQQVRRSTEAAEAAARAHAAIPRLVRERLARAAQQPERSSFRQFFTAIYKYLPDRWTVASAVLALYQWYVAMHEEQQLASHRPDWNFSGMGPMAAWNPPTPMAPPNDGPGFFAPADGSGSVVDAVFAKAGEAGKRRARAPMRA